MKIKVLYFSLMSVLMLSAPCFSVTLTELEKRIGQSDDVMLRRIGVSQAVSDTEKARADSGLRLSAGAGYSWNRAPESLTSSDMVYYEKLYGQVALTLPVLGSRWQEQAGILKTERSLLERKRDEEIYSKTALASLRKSYIDVWVSEKKRSLCRSFLNDERAVTDALKLRIRPGLLLKADFMEFMTTFGKARREEAHANRVIGSASERIGRLTGLRPDPSAMAAPDLPGPEMDPSKIERSMAIYNPELDLLDQIVSKNRDILKKTTWSGFESNVELAYAPGKTYPGAFGNGASVRFSITAPLDIMASNRAAEKSADDEIRKSQLVLQAIKKETLADYAAFQSAYRESLENLAFADQRLASACEWEREARLRLTCLEGDVLEKYMQARYAVFGSALDVLDAEAGVFKACSDLLLIGEDKTTPGPRSFAPEKLPGYEARKRYLDSADFSAGLLKSGRLKHNGVKGRFGVYIWDSAGILGNRSEGFWGQLKKNGVDRILVSFDAKQIRQIRNGTVSDSLKQLIEDAGRHRVMIELLLGEPSWILPEKRRNLLDIITVFKDFEFDGLHLDIEPDQLKIRNDAERDVLAGYVVDTLKAVTAISRWPVGVSIHPRYFDETRSGVCLGCGLEKLGINEVALMIYSSDIERVSDRARKIMAAYPLIMFSVAQSVEPSLPGTESHYRKGGAVFLKDMNRLSERVGNTNFYSILIQSWKDMLKVRRR